IQHDGYAAELSAAREFIEISWTGGGHDADSTDPAPAIRLASDPAKFHWQFAVFAGMRRTAQHSHQCDAKSRANERHPTSDFHPASASRGWIGDAGALRGSGPRDEHGSVTSA